MNFLDLIWLIPLFPAAGFVINGLLGKRMSKTAVGVIGCGVVLISFIFSAGAVYQLLQLDAEHRSHTLTLYRWINGGLAHTRSGGVADFSASCMRSEEHTSELQSHSDLVCRL